jgi:serine O-acetyltransferase
MGWLRDYRRDVEHYQKYQGHSWFREIATQQGLWALLQYRIASSVYRSSLPPRIKQPVLVPLYLWRKAVEVTTGISLPHTATIGAGLYLNHFGNIILNNDARVGEDCDISQGVTVGVSGRGDRRGTPKIGDRVYVGPNAVIAGKISVGDNAMVSANSLVLSDVPRRAVVRGVPAVVVRVDDKQIDDEEADASPQGQERPS